MKSLKDKVVVITGAAGGIGRALAHNASGQGAKLAICDMNEAGLAETAELSGTTDVITAKVDVADRSQVEGFRDQVVAHYGHADVVINNAGVAVSQTIEDLTYEDFEWIMGINFWGMVYGSKAFLPILKQRPEAGLVNLSSIFGIISVPTQGSYNASKFAIRGFTEALRHEMAHTNVHVMCVHPGGIKTDIARNARFYVGPDGDKSHDKSASKFDKMVRTSPEDAAKKIYKDLAAGKGRCLIGADAKIIDAWQRAVPTRYWSLVEGLMQRQSK